MGITVFNDKAIYTDHLIHLLTCILTNIDKECYIITLQVIVYLNIFNYLHMYMGDQECA